MDRESEINIDRVVPTGGLEPGAILSLAFATECEGLNLAYSCRAGNITEDDIRKIAEDTGDSEPLIALGWLARWRNAIR